MLYRRYAELVYLQIYLLYFKTRDMTEIVKHLWLGTPINASDRGWLESHHIKHVLIVAKEGAIIYPNRFIYKKFPALSDPLTDIKKYLSQIVHYIYKNKKFGGILVHCSSGSDRARLAIISYLVKQEKMELGVARSLLKQLKITEYSSPRLNDAIVQGFIVKCKRLNEKKRINLKKKILERESEGSSEIYSSLNFVSTPDTFKRDLGSSHFKMSSSVQHGFSEGSKITMKTQGPRVMMFSTEEGNLDSYFTSKPSAPANLAISEVDSMKDPVNYSSMVDLTPTLPIAKKKLKVRKKARSKQKESQTQAKRRGHPKQASLSYLQGSPGESMLYSLKHRRKIAHNRSKNKSVNIYGNMSNQVSLTDRCSNQKSSFNQIRVKYTDLAGYRFKRSIDKK